MDGSKPVTVGKVQATTLKDPGIKGKLWVATEKIMAPKPTEEGIREAVFTAIEELRPEKAGELSYTKPNLVDIEVEWTGDRPNAGKDDPLLTMSEEDKYRSLMAEPSRTSETTVLYFHGGAYYLCDPSTHRIPCSRIAKETGGRVCSVRYRLAPQTAFPGQLLDALMVYLSLLYPPPGSMHEAVSEKHIVLAGDSAGGNLSFALLQLLLQLHRTDAYRSLRFHGKEVEVPLPAGVVANSGWFDITRSMPSLLKNAAFDYLPPPKEDDDYLTRMPKDSIWPADPPRGDLFCDLTLSDHTLVSPLAATSWEGSPPLWLCTGQELLRDEDAIVASRAASQGVKVIYEEYEAMPHCFGMLLPFLPTAERCIKSCSNFCKRCVEEPGTVATSGTYVYAKSGKEVALNVVEASTMDFDEVRRSMSATKDNQLATFAKSNNAIAKSTL